MFFVIFMNLLFHTIPSTISFILNLRQVKSIRRFTILSMVRCGFRIPLMLLEEICIWLKVNLYWVLILGDPTLLG